MLYVCSLCSIQKVNQARRCGLALLIGNQTARSRLSCQQFEEAEILGRIHCFIFGYLIVPYERDVFPHRALEEWSIYQPNFVSWWHIVQKILDFKVRHIRF